MSDGHFNRALLPRTDYQSGHRAGQAATKKLAETAFLKTVETVFPKATEEEIEVACKLFKELLNS